MASSEEKASKKGSAAVRPIVSVISGGIAGAVEAFATYPMELGKTRIQLRQKAGVKQPRNPFKVVSTIYRTEGLRALYAGCTPLVIGSVGKDAVRFLAFDSVKNAFKDPETGRLGPMRNLGAGMAAGVVASIVSVTPTERLKTALVDDARDAKRFKGAMDAIKTILKEDGLIGMYRGFAGTTLKQAVATACRMGSYNVLKDYETRHGYVQSTPVNFVNGAIAGIITTLVSQPADCIKTRSQSAHRTTTMEAVRSIIADDGILGFWKGTVMRLGRTVMAGGILFTTAEGVAKIIEPFFARMPLT